MIYSLSIYYSSTTGGRAEYITEDEKDPFDIVMQISSNSIILVAFCIFLGGGGGASQFLKAHLEGSCLVQFSFEGVKMFCCAF